MIKLSNILPEIRVELKPSIVFTEKARIDTDKYIQLTQLMSHFNASDLQEAISDELKNNEYFRYIVDLMVVIWDGFFDVNKKYNKDEFIEILQEYNPSRALDIYNGLIKHNLIKKR